MINFHKTNRIEPYIYLFCFKVLFQLKILNHANGIKLWHIHIHIQKKDFFLIFSMYL